VDLAELEELLYRANAGEQACTEQCKAGGTEEWDGPVVTHDLRDRAQHTRAVPECSQLRRTASRPILV
jgi:hypothetical protein